MSTAAGESLRREPKYYTVKRHLLDIIESLPPGTPVPTERELTVRLGTSRTTVRQALGELVGDGRVVRRQGSGTFVAEPKLSWPLQVSSFTAQASAPGYVPSTRLLESRKVRADDRIAGLLQLAPGSWIYRLERLRLVNDAPMAVETSHLPAARFPGLTTRLRSASSLYAVLAEHYGVAPATAEQTIETAAASPREAELLDTDTGAPMLVLARHSFDAGGVPLEWVRSFYRGDRYKFVARLTV